MIPLCLLLCALLPSLPPALTAGAAGAHGLQEPEDPSRVLNLLDGLIERAQESSPILAFFIRFLAVIVFLVLHFKVWGPSVLVTIILVVGFLVWQGRRTKEQPPSKEEELENEPEL